MENITTPVSETPIIVEKPKKNYFNLILISFCFIAFTTGAFFLGQRSIKNTKTPDTVLPKSTSFPKATPTQTLNWKTYNDKSYGISFAYPNTWEIQSTENYIRARKIKDESTFIVSVDFKKTNLTISELISKLKSEDSVFEQINTNLKSEKMVINEYSADKIKYTDATGLQNIKIIVTNGTNKILIEYRLMTDSIVDQILSTFKFTGDLVSTEKSQGTITGALCYPSSFIPAGKIIAKNITTKETFSQEYLGSSKSSSNKFSFDVPEGTYHLKFTSENGTSGYYNSCAKTMAATECDVDSNHKNLDIVVKSGQVLKDINPCDFYYSDSQKTIVESTY